MEHHPSLSAETPWNDESLMKLMHVLDFIFGALAVVGNGFCLFVFMSNSQLCRPSNYHLVSLTFADMLSGLTGPLFTYLTNRHVRMDDSLCIMLCSGLSYFYIVQLCCLVCTAVNRWRKFSQHGRPGSKFTIVVALIVCWAFPAIIACLPLLGWAQNWSETYEKCYFDRLIDRWYLAFIYFAVVIPAFVIMTSLYIHIHIIGRKRIRQLEALEMPYDRMQELERERRSICFVYVLVLACGVCWLPVFTLDAIMAMGGLRFDRLRTYILVLLAHVNVTIDPLLYAYKYSEFRQAARLYFVRCGNLFCRRKVKTRQLIKYKDAHNSYGGLQNKLPNRMQHYNVLH